MNLFKRSHDGTLNIAHDLWQIRCSTPEQLLRRPFSNGETGENILEKAINYRNANNHDNFLGSDITLIDLKGSPTIDSDAPAHAEQVIRAIAAKLTDEQLKDYMGEEIILSVVEGRKHAQEVANSTQQTTPTYVAGRSLP